MSETTIVHISVCQMVAVVTYNGIARMFRLKLIPPMELVKMYVSRGYKYTWLNDDTILLTKKVTGLRKVQVAA